jgi:very-short-patch-repair endonuclease
MNTFYPYNSRLKKLARELRQNMTLGEVLLWQKIRGHQLGYQFHRQVPISEYIVDFYCHELFLAIEVDGSTHDHPDVAVSDLSRQSELESLGIKFIRFEEKEIRDNVDTVVEVVERWIDFNKISP